MVTKSLTYWIVIVTLSFASCDVNNFCKIKNYEGTCQVITSCKFAINLLKNKDVTTLRHMTCGYEGTVPMVCCPNQSVEKTTRRIRTTTVPYQDALYSKDVVTAPPASPPPRLISDILPGRNVCGQLNIGDRIYGGQITEIDEFPWLARIKFYNPALDTYTYGCSGSLINDRYVLTAAHCIGILKVVGVRLGEWDTETEIDCQNEVCADPPLDVKVVKSIVYPGFDRNDVTDGNDIALLRLERPVEFTDFIRPVCLPTTRYIAGQDYTDSTYTTTGWGLTEYDQESILKLKVSLNSVPYDLCRAALNLSDKKPPKVICAGGKKDQDTCKGDSGGPLLRVVAENYQQNWYIYGITSYGITKCGAAASPGIYTRVSSYMDWILQTISAG